MRSQQGVKGIHSIAECVCVCVFVCVFVLAPDIKKQNDPMYGASVCGRGLLVTPVILQGCRDDSIWQVSR